MKSQKIIQYNLTAKLPFIGVLIITTFITFFTETKLTSANDSFHEVLVRKDNPSTPTEELFTGQFSTNASDLLANPQNKRLNIDFSRYVNIEVGERSCDAAYGLAKSGASVFVHIYLPNIPASTITIFVTTPTRGRQTVKLESEESIAPELQKKCYEMINTTRELDSKLHILQIHKPVQHSELDLTIQNSWNILNRKD